METIHLHVITVTNDDYEVTDGMRWRTVGYFSSATRLVTASSVPGDRQSVRSLKPANDASIRPIVNCPSDRIDIAPRSGGPNELALD